MNVAIISGRLTADPQARKVKVGGNEVTVANFTLAVRDRFAKDESGNYTDEGVQFIRVAAWRGLGDTAAKYLTKGRKIEVRGPIKLNTYLDAHQQPHAVIELRAEGMEFCDAKPQETVATEAAEEAELPFE